MTRFVHRLTLVFLTALAPACGTLFDTSDILYEAGGEDAGGFPDAEQDTSDNPDTPSPEPEPDVPDVGSMPSDLVDCPEGEGTCTVRLAEGSPASNHTCALMADGQARCWGYDRDGQIGSGTRIYDTTGPLAAQLDRPAVSAALGGAFTCFLLDEGSAACTGVNFERQLGVLPNDGTNVFATSTPLAVTRLGMIQQLAAGRSHGCALIENGEVWCWGLNDFGQVGSSEDLYAVQAPTRVDFGDAPPATQLVAGAFHTCALLEDHTIWCWGATAFGQLGSIPLDELDPCSNTPCSSNPVLMETRLTNPDQIVAGGYHTCALQIDGGMLDCWGHNTEGQLGAGHNMPVEGTFNPVEGVDNPVEVAAGAHHTCARNAAGRVWCWGDNSTRQLGVNDERELVLSPTEIGFFEGALQLALGDWHTCARRADDVICWGNNEAGQLGDGTDDPLRAFPEAQFAVIGLDVTEFIAAGAYHTCAIAEGEARCWGNALDGRLGEGEPLYRLRPTPVAGLDAPEHLAIGGSHTCAQHSPGLSCWGRNDMRQLAQADERPRNVPTQILDTEGGDLIALGDSHGCVLNGDGQVICWGNNTEGQLGDGTRNVRARPEVAIEGASHVSAGHWHTCAVQGEGAVVCWGSNNYGQLGAPFEAQHCDLGPCSLSPLAAALGEEAHTVRGGGNHTCAVAGEARQVFCWGNNESGQLGDPSAESGPTPVRAEALEGVVDIAAGINHTCALLDTGEVFCWGRNNEGQLGYVAEDNCFNGPCSNIPRRVPGLQDVVQLISGDSHTCALLQQGEVRCWGRGAAGQLGDNTATSRPYHAPITP